MYIFLIICLIVICNFILYKITRKTHPKKSVHEELQETLEERKKILSKIKYFN